MARNFVFLGPQGSGKGTVIGTKTIMLSGKPEEVELNYKPEKAGKFILTARVAPQESELLDTDNKRSGLYLLQVLIEAKRADNDLTN